MKKNKEDLRKQIDLIDCQISALLKERFECAKQLGQLKKENRLPITDENREQKVYENVTKEFELASEKEAVKRIYSIIINECTNVQK